ncbi:MAG: glycoside hydrolase [Candidatus Aminicenantes bacterium]|nr:glycoside hydrolase [Candidatus Aminicenantes bacterium]
MKKGFLFIVLVTLLLCGSACSRDLVPDHILEGLHKPVIDRLSPAAIQFNGAGFFLNVATEYLEDDQYVLYINDRKIGQDVPGYWRTSLGWMLPKELVGELLGSKESATCSVRVTGINQSYDISGDFDKYADYVSDPIPLEIKKGETRFSVSSKLFPEWTHSREPLIRCDGSGNIYLAWLELLNGSYQAFFCFSRDAGASWSQVLNISRSDQSTYDVDLAVDGQGHFYMVWNCQAWGSNGLSVSDVFFSRSLDNGATWHLPRRLNGQGELATCPVINVDEGGVIAIAWNIHVGQKVDALRLSTSPDLGQSWKSREFAVPEAGEWDEPVLASRADGFRCLVSGGFLDASHGFYFFSSADRGVTWRSQEILTGGYQRVPFAYFSAARCGLEGQMYFVWGDSSMGVGHSTYNGNYFLRREASGDWSAVQGLHEICRTVNEKTALSVRPDGIDVVLTENGGLFLLRSADEGRTWSIPEFIPGADGLLATTSPDTVRHPSGKTFLVYIRKNTPMDGGLYLTMFE